MTAFENLVAVLAFLERAAFHEEAHAGQRGHGRRVLPALASQWPSRGLLLLEPLQPLFDGSLDFAFLPGLLLVLGRLDRGRRGQCEKSRGNSDRDHREQPTSGHGYSPLEFPLRQVFAPTGLRVVDKRRPTGKTLTRGGTTAVTNRARSNAGVIHLECRGAELRDSGIAPPNPNATLDSTRITPAFERTCSVHKLTTPGKGSGRRGSRHCGAGRSSPRRQLGTALRGSTAGCRHFFASSGLM